MTTDTIPTIISYHEAVDLLHELGRAHDWVSVFWDRGWGDSGERAEISIIVGGNGQEPKAWITPEVYRGLRDAKVIGENSYGGYKARRLHDFKSPPMSEPSVNPADVAEVVIRDLIAAHPERPIVAEFWRGLVRTPLGPQPQYDIIATPAAEVDGRFVMLKPGHADVAMSAQEPDFLGPRIIGDRIATCLPYPTVVDRDVETDNDVDMQALRGEAFAAELLAAIDEKVAVIEDARRAGNR